MFPRALLHVAVVSRLWSVPLARGFHATAASRGMFDGLKAMVGSQTESAKKKKLEELFAYQLKFIMDTPTYTLADHTRLLETLAEQAGANSWRTMLMTEAAKGDLAEQLVDLKIGAAFTPAEVAGHKHSSMTSTINGKARARVAAAVGSDVGRVNRFLDNFRQSALMHEWLHSRKAKGALQWAAACRSSVAATGAVQLTHTHSLSRAPQLAAGLALPQTPEEYANCMVADRVGMGKKAQQAAGGGGRGGSGSMRAMLKRL